MFAALRRSFKDVVCPYCFEGVSLRDTPFRCASPPSLCAPERDPVFKQAWGADELMGQALPSKGLAREVRCPGCFKQTRKRLCPLCHMDLPASMGECENLIFALIGASQAGKSNFIAVLIDQLKNRVGPAIDMLVEPQNDRTIKRYREEFYEPVFRKGKPVDATLVAFAGGSAARFPLVFSLSFLQKTAFGGQRIKRTVTLAFFDTAGEDLNDQDTMSTVSKYIYRADGILLLLDPLQLGAVREALPAGTGLPEQKTETGEIVTRMTNLILAARSLGPTAQIDTPLAVAFSKFDALAPLLDPQSQLKQSAQHVAGFDQRDFEAVSGEVQALLASWRSESLLQQVRVRYPRHGFFGLSALGCNPHGTNRIERVLPWRVEDPFLWLLYQHGLIKPVRG
jgi:GTPase SAR1 family protein